MAVNRGNIWVNKRKYELKQWSLGIKALCIFLM